MKYNPLIKPHISRVLKAGRIILSHDEEVGEHVNDKREEIIIVLSGTATLLKENKSVILKEGEAHYIKEGTKHNVRNDSRRKLEYIYVVGTFQ